MTKNINEINVGDGATLSIGSDSYPATVISKTKNTIIVQEDDAISTGNNRFQYTYEPNSIGQTYVCKLTKNGWKSKPFNVNFGKRLYYRDPHF